MTTINFVPATPELLRRFYGELARTQRSVVVFRNSEPIAVAGCYTDQKHVVLFSDITPEIRKALPGNRQLIRALINTTKHVLKMAKRMGMPIYALAEPTVCGSDRLLTHFGFKHYMGDIYSWEP